MYVTVSSGYSCEVIKLSLYALYEFYTRTLICTILHNFTIEVG
jgi:hypothetical protein